MILTTAEPLALDACRALVDAYDRGAERGGSMEWDDVDRARALAQRALDGAGAAPDLLAAAAPAMLDALRYILGHHDHLLSQRAHDRARRAIRAAEGSSS